MPENPPASTDRVIFALGDVRSRLGDGLPIYIDELLKWNPQLGLVSKRQPTETVAKLIQQSVELYDFTVAHTSAPVSQVLDIGSGGGFPGLVWKLLDPSLQVTLIERKERKAGFLGRVAHRLSVPGIEVRAEDVHTTASISIYGGIYDAVTMMAVALTGGLAADIRKLLKPGGVLATIRPADAPAVDGLSERARLDREDSAMVLFD